MTQPWDRVKTLYDQNLLRQLTNAGNPGASTINDTIGNSAAAFALEEFANVVQVSYDDTILSHQFAINELVIFILQTWANKLGEAASKRQEIVYSRLKTLAKSRGGRNRCTPVSSSPDQTTDDSRNGAISNPKPEFDLTSFDGVTPNGPSAGNQTDSFPFPG